ncbi:PQQ-binding-like beta-propeller repeat protein [candidate division KSB1 bacterium]|nr:PQQ-binding-like beta-propeller repeat protein [candidate division KSB1 bacterium]
MQACKHYFFILIFLLFSTVIFASHNQLMSALNDPLILDRKINDDTGNAVQEGAAMAKHPRGPAVVCWADYRNTHGDIYMQLFNKKGFPYNNSPNVKVNDDGADAQQLTPHVAMDDYGHFVVVWGDRRNGNWDIYAQIYMANGYKLGPNFKVNDDTGTAEQLFPVIAKSRDGRFFVAWSDTRQGTKRDIYGQFFDADGNPLGSNMMINEDTTGIQIKPEIDINQQGEIVVTWLDFRGDKPHIYARALYEGGGFKSDEFWVSQYMADDMGCLEHAVSLLEDGSFLVSWLATSDGANSIIYGRIFNRYYDPVTNPFIMTDESDDHWKNDVDVYRYREASEDGWIVTWDSIKRGDYDIYFCAILSNGMLIPFGTPINDRPGDQSRPQVVTDDDENIIFVWTDNRNGNKDIFATWLGELKPNHVSAGEGYDGLIPISWQPSYGYDRLVKYNIYRAVAGSDFELIATVDPATRPFPELMHDWIDRTVENNQTYYYRVEMDVEGGTHVGFKAYASSAGHRIRSNWLKQPVTIDGTISSQEWDDAARYDISSETARHPVMLYLKNSANMLYIAVEDQNDAIFDPGNNLSLLFDDDHNGRWDATAPSNEGLIMINQAGAAFLGYWGNYPEGLGGDVPKVAAGVTSATGTGTGTVQYEVSIDLSRSPLAALPGEQIGIALAVKDPGNYYEDHYNNAGEFPKGALWEAAETLGDLILSKSADTLYTGDWRMINQNKERTSWAKGEKELYPPFEYISEIPVDLQGMTNLSYWRGTLFMESSTVPNKVYAVDPVTGNENWHFDIPGTGYDTYCTPAIHNGLVFCGGQRGAGMYAVSAETGSQNWLAETGEFFSSSPVVDGDRVYVIYDSVYCIDIAYGDVQWSVPVPTFTGSNTLPAIDDENIYVCISGHIQCHDKMTGDLKWQIEKYTNQLMVDEFYLYTLGLEFVEALNKEDGSTVWLNDHWGGMNDAPRQQSMALTNNYLVFTILSDYQNHSYLCSLDKLSGDYIWYHEFDTTGAYMPSIANDVVYMVHWDDYGYAGGDNSLWGFDVHTGDVVFHDDSEQYIGQPIVGDNAMFVAADDKIKVFRNSPVTKLESEIENPQISALQQNFPNPFNPDTKIRFHVEQPSRVELTVYNLIGQKIETVTDQFYQAGVYEVQFNAKGLASGIYLYRAKIGTQEFTNKMIVLE